jgi:hypothetical protein
LIISAFGFNTFFKKEDLGMKKRVAILSVIFFLFLLIVPKQTMADGSGAAQGALIGGAIGLVVGIIIYAVSASSETPMDKQKSEIETKQVSKLDNGFNTYSDNFETMAPKTETPTVKLNLFCISF